MASSRSNNNSEIRHARLVSRVNRLFEKLANEGIDKSRNRKFLYSHYASLILLSFFNPAMQTLRGIQKASELKSVQKRLQVRRVSQGSLSESASVFDPDLLVPLVQEMLSEHQTDGPGPNRNTNGIPPELVKKLVAVDGSAIRSLGSMVQCKLHLQFQVLNGMPESFTMADGSHDERDEFTLNLQPQRIYIGDRGYERYALYNHIIAAKSDYVIRGQARPARVVEERSLVQEDREARVIEDAIIKLNIGENTAKTAIIDHSVRRITIAKRASGRQRADRPQNNDLVILYTSLTDKTIPAHVIAGIYELRWSIELFFRFLKQMLGLKRLFSTHSEANAIHVYCAIIAGLLLSQLTGGKVTMDDYRFILFYLQGWADDQELEAYLAKARKRNKPKNTS